MELGNKGRVLPHERHGRIRQGNHVHDGAVTLNAADRQGGYGILCGGDGERVGGKCVAVYRPFRFHHAAQSKAGTAFGTDRQKQIALSRSGEGVVCPIAGCLAKSAAQRVAAHHFVSHNLPDAHALRGQILLGGGIRQQKRVVFHAVHGGVVPVAERLYPGGVFAVRQRILHGSQIVQTQLLRHTGVVVSLYFDHIGVVIQTDVGNIAVQTVLPLQLKPIGIQGQILHGKPGEVKGLLPFGGKMSLALIVPGEDGEMESGTAGGLGGVHDAGDVGGVGAPLRQGNVPGACHPIEIFPVLGDKFIVHYIPSQIIFEIGCEKMRVLS